MYTRTDEKARRAAKNRRAGHRACWVDMVNDRSAVALRGQVKGPVPGRDLDDLAVTSLTGTYNLPTTHPLIRGVATGSGKLTTDVAVNMG